MIGQSVAEIGAQAMQRPFARIANPDQPVRKVVLSGRWVVRGSTRTG